MDHRRQPHQYQRYIALVLSFTLFFDFTGASGVFRVQRKYSDRTHISDLRAHDTRRHGRILSSSATGAVDIPLGGIGIPTETGLYYAKIGIGTPSKPYYVQVDTGSDILWVNCITCKHCPKKSDLSVICGFDIHVFRNYDPAFIFMNGFSHQLASLSLNFLFTSVVLESVCLQIQHSLYDFNKSSSADIVSCDANFCSSTYGGEVPGCVHDAPCQYTLVYGDGSSTAGYFVTDSVQYNQVSGDHRTETVNASVTFGCGAQLSGDLGSSTEPVDGILGFGQSNTSMLSQLASAGKARKVFSHCLDTKRGGGIFAIGQVVEPKVKTTPLVPDMSHYNVILKSIQIGATFLKIPTDTFETGDKKGTIIDSGTTLVYLPEQAFKPVMNAIFSYQPGLRFKIIQDFLCFKFSGRLDDGFPIISFHFEDSLELPVYPHDYFFTVGDDYCSGFQNSAVQSKDGQDMILLGDMVLANKLVVYDLENQNVGWTDHNCALSIKIQDGNTTTDYAVDAHILSSAGRSEMGGFVAFLMSAYLMLNLFH